MTRIRFMAVMLGLLLLLTACGQSQPSTPAPAPAQGNSTPSAAPAPPDPIKNRDAYLAQLHDAAKKEGELVFYHSGDSNQMDALIKKFEAKYPGVKVQQFKGQGGLGAVEAFEAEFRAGKFIADVLDAAGDEVWPDMVKRGLFMKLTSANFGIYPDYYRIGSATEGYGVVIRVTRPVLLWNTKYAPKGAFKSYRDVIKPEYAGKIAMTDARATSAGFRQFLAWYHNQEYGPELKQLYEQIATVKPKLYSSSTQAAQSVISGENVACLFCSAGIVFGVLTDTPGAPIDWVIPEKEAFAKGIYVGVSAKAPHPNAAKLFWEWLASDEGVKVYGEVYGSVSLAKSLPAGFATLRGNEMVGDAAKAAAVDEKAVHKAFEDLFRAPPLKQ